MACDASGRLLATARADGRVHVWDVDAGFCTHYFEGHTGIVTSILFHPDPNNLILFSASDETTVWAWDLVAKKSKQCAATMKNHASAVVSLAVSEYRRFLIRECQGSGASSLPTQLIPNHGQDRTARLFKLPELVEVASLVGHKQGIWSVEFSPVDPCVLTASADKTIKLWSVRDHSCLKTFEGHTSSILGASFISRGAQLVSTDNDGLLKLWSVKSNDCIATYDQHEDKVRVLHFDIPFTCLKTEMLATGGDDAVLNLWNDSTTAEKEEAFRIEQEGVLRGQDLENAISDGDNAKAILLAFELRKPHKLLELLSELYRKNITIDHVRSALQALVKEELGRLLEYIREWNTKPKLCHVANSVLLQAFSMHSPTDIDEVKGIGELLEGLIAYSQRHYRRIEMIERSLFTLDYTLNSMSVIDPEDDSTLKGNLDRETASDVQEEDIIKIMETKPNKRSRKRKSRNSIETNLYRDG
ncbi:hypothetical protein KSS87_007062 [Heliosperma pusillum]|nr:hypothetical protein KSS87_007062 [Heliosperma pusillum]